MDEVLESMLCWRAMKWEFQECVDSPLAFCFHFTIDRAMNEREICWLHYFKIVWQKYNFLLIGFPLKARSMDKRKLTAENSKIKKVNEGRCFNF